MSTPEKMSTLEKLGKLNKQVELAYSMVKATDPRAAEEQRSITAMISRINADIVLRHFDEAANKAGELRRLLIKLQKGWAMGESSATGRVLTQVEALAGEIEAELRQKATGR
jgi:hypothetical protein